MRSKAPIAGAVADRIIQLVIALDNWAEAVRNHVGDANRDQVSRETYRLLRGAIQGVLTDAGLS